MDEKAKRIISLDVDEPTACALCYIPALGVLPSVAFLILEKSERLRWNAMQAILLWVTVLFSAAILDVTRVLAGLVPLVDLLGIVVLPLAMAIRAHQEETTRIPLIAELAEKILNLKVKKK